MIYDVFIIDEPEVHLNWHLEERLFSYLKYFSDTYGKQLIIATHSRVVFKPDFLDKVRFLYWQNNQIICSREISNEMRRKIAGEAIDIIKLGNFPKHTFFVEDRMARIVIEEMAAILGEDVLISVVDNSSNVKSLYKLSKSEGEWSNCVFVTDGDNQGNPYPGESNFIHLDKYCIENYLLDFDISSSISGKTPDQIREFILEATKSKRDSILKKNK